jgi:excisionase family DNA binding protein
VTFRLLYVFFVLSLKRRRLLHVNVTAHPHQTWTAQQVVEAVGFDTDIARLIRDRDGIYGSAFDSRVNHLGIRQVKTAPRSPWQNGYAERLVGTLRREVLDHVIVLGERHLLRLVGVCRSTVYQLCERGELVHVRVSNAIRVPVAAVAEYLRQQSD